ncbi:MAG: flagellar hook-associated protein FlgK [Nitrospirota bacterium]
MSILGVFDIGKTAMYVTRKALDTTAHNVANINTPGYTRQELVLESVPSGVLSSTGLSGRGVKTTGVQRLYDSFIALQLRNEKSNLAYWEAYGEGIVKIENVFNEASDVNLSTSINDFFNAWQELSNNPEGYAERSLLIKKAEYLTARINRAYTTLDEERNELVKSNEFLVDEVNTITAKIADLNEKISASPGSLDLKDQRDGLIERLNEIVKVTTFEDNVGRYAVMISGVPLVDGARVFQLDSSIDISNNLHFYVNFTDSRGVLTETREVSHYITGGELKANYDLRDAQIPEYLDKLNIMAINLSDVVNYYHRQGYGTDGSTGNNFFSFATNTITDSDPSAGATITSLSITNTNSVSFSNQYRSDYVDAVAYAALPPADQADYIQEGTTGFYWRVQKSTDDGATWTTIAPNTLFDPSDPSTLDLSRVNLTPSSTAGSWRTLEFEGIKVRFDNNLIAAGEAFSFRLNTNAALEIAVAITEPQKVAAAEGDLVTVDETNNNIRFSEDGGSTFVTATIPSGVYTRSELADKLKQALENADSAKAYQYTVVYNSGTKKYTITNEDGVAGVGPNDNPNAIVFDWTNAASTGRGLFGFTSNSHINAAGSDTGDNAVYPNIPGDNKNAKMIAGLASQLIIAGRKPIDFYREIVSDVAVESLSAKDSQKFQRALVSELEGRREEISGISLDEEAANLVKYQKSFEAAAKMIGIADELLEVLLGMTGR